MAHPAQDTSLELYDEAAQAAAAQVISRYSTSFGLGTRLLPRAQRRHIESVYAMVRVADEIVDTYQGPDAATLLDGFEAEVERAMGGSFSTNLVAHAFGSTARAVGIERELVDPFFASMRMDLLRTQHDEASLAAYIHGSAEVVGEMCLAVFVNTSTGPRPLDPELRAGARSLGSAYQKVNFLRDLGADTAELGRSYFPGVTASSLTDHRLAELVADCRADLDAARGPLARLPRRAQVGVRTTVDIYERLLDRIAATPASELAGRRIRVPNQTKLVLAARNLAHRGAATPGSTTAATA
ncbi:phytoene/squalene synthase family protein [Demequina sp. NBRC 110056]|uniref:phytoene/squalene synthase family protein n=1 Tax=Demequina sp. NBRC 110056 TaxID=1570345 RepID=UPI001F2E12BC|nr:phytoene/squalene synthase family protein [Demequina sp. NBRC 110056]